MSARLQLWVLCGGNGAGKSTFYQQFLQASGLPFINADILARELDPERAAAMSYQAALLAGKLRKNLLRRQLSFCFETVFSHPSKIDFLAEAKSFGYEIIVVYVHLQTDELNQARVAQRVMQGGHDVPTDKIISRIPRTMCNVHAALPFVDIAVLYDNSSAAHPYDTIATLQNGRLDKRQELPYLPQWAEDILSEYV